MRYKAAVFDMDGTILNTLDDLTSSLDYALGVTGHRHDYTNDAVRIFFGSGALVACRRALACEKTGIVSLDVPEDPDLDREAERVQGVFRTYYVDHCAIKTGPYPGIEELIHALKRSGVKAAVVSNKPDPAVRELADDYFPGLFACSIGEQPGVRRKPAPDTVLKVIGQFGVTKEETVYIGDSEVDIETARNAGTDVISVDWGFRTRAFLETKHPDRIVSSPKELETILLS